MHPHDKGGLFMVDVVAEFYQVTGIDQTPPQNLAELIPYILAVVIAVALVSGVFGIIGKLADLILNIRRW